MADPAHTTPTTLQEVLAKAKGGQTIVLAPGVFSDVVISGRHYSPSITIEAKDAKLVSWTMKDVSGVIIRHAHVSPDGPKISPKTGKPLYGNSLLMQNVSEIEVSDSTFEGPGQADAKVSGVFGDGYGLNIHGGRKLTIARNAFSGLKIGLLISETDGFQVADNTFTSMRSDGMDVALSHNGVIEGNHCWGTVVRTQEHPDCIQMWSRPPATPTSDMVVRHNKVEGDTQGISLFNHVRDGVDDGGFDRILIEDNDVSVTASQAIAIVGGRNSIIRNNRVTSLPGGPYRASINTYSSDVVRCGNVVSPGGKNKPGIVDPKC